MRLLHRVQDVDNAAAMHAPGDGMRLVFIAKGHPQRIREQ